MGQPGSGRTGTSHLAAFDGTDGRSKGRRRGGAAVEAGAQRVRVRLVDRTPSAARTGNGGRADSVAGAARRRARRAAAVAGGAGTVPARVSAVRAVRRGNERENLPSVRGNSGLVTRDFPRQASGQSPRLRSGQAGLAESVQAGRPALLGQASGTLTLRDSGVRKNARFQIEPQALNPEGRNHHARENSIHCD